MMTYRIESDGNIYNDETGATVLLCEDAKRLARRLIAERDRQAEFGRSYKYSYERACEQRDEAIANARLLHQAWLHRHAVAKERIAELEAKLKDKRELVDALLLEIESILATVEDAGVERDYAYPPSGHVLELATRHNEARDAADQAIGDLRAVASLAIGAEEEQAIVDVAQHAAALLMKVKDGDHE